MLVTLAIYIKRSFIPAGESVEVVVALRNTSDKAHSFYGIDPDDHTIHFELEGPSEEVQYLDYNQALMRRGDDPEIHAHLEEITLRPGDAFEAAYQLCQMSGYLAPGSYRVRASYEDGYLTSGWSSFEIEPPQAIERIGSTWDYNRTALSHLLSVVEMPAQQQQKSVYWLEESEKVHSFLFRHHALTRVPAGASPFLSHTTSFLQPNRHLLWRSESTLQAIPVRDGEVAGASFAVRAPTAGGALLDTAYTMRDGLLVVFATAFSAQGDILLWRGRVKENTGPDWTQLLELSAAAQSSHRKTHPVVQVQYDVADALHAVIVQPDDTGFYYVQWDSSLQHSRQHHDVYAWRSFQSASFQHGWSDDDTFPPSVQTELSLLFQRTDRSRWERWTYTLEEETFDREIHPFAPAFPSRLIHLDGQIDKNGQMHCIWEWDENHYYSWGGTSYLVRLDSGETQFFPQVLVDGDPVAEETTASCRYRDEQGAFHFRELTAPDDPEFSLEINEEPIDENSELQLSITLSNPGPDGLLLPALQIPEAGLTIHVGPDGGASGRGYVFASEECLQADQSRVVNDLPLGIRACQVKPIADLSTWFELEPNEEIVFAARVPLDVEPGPYQVYARLDWAKRQTFAVSFKV